MKAHAETGIKAKTSCCGGGPATGALLEWLCSTDGAPMHRGMIIAAHPDDEVIGVGARISRLSGCRFIHVTDGAPRDLKDAHRHGFAGWQDYAQARRQEFLAVLSLAGIPPQQSVALGYPDQESSFHLVELVKKLRDMILCLEPEFILTHPYEGGHPDHDSTCFAVHSACHLIALHGYPTPPRIEFCSYHQGPSGIQTGQFLEGNPSQRIAGLTLRQKKFKLRLFDCYATQQQVLELFAVEHECFREAPEYDFGAAPHPGTLFYEQYPWGLSGARWRDLARMARENLCRLEGGLA